MPTKISQQGLHRPAPKWWRNLERGLLLILIPAATVIIQSWDFGGNEVLKVKWNLGINTGLTAIVKFIGMMLVDTEDNYVSNLPQSEQDQLESIDKPVPDKA